MKSFLKAFLFVFFLSCSFENEPDEVSALYSIQNSASNFTFIASLNRYQQVDFNRLDPANCKVEYQLEEINRRANILNLRVKRPENCQVHYELIWDGLVMESLPMRIQLYLVPVFQSCVPSSRSKVDDIEVDLEKVLKFVPKEDIEDLVIYLRAFCAYEDYLCEGDCQIRTDN